MAQNKKNEFENDVVEIAEIFKALSHPARLQILKVLAQKQTCICGEIVEVMPLAQATVSQHLKELKESGIIKGEVEGKKSCYCIDWEKLEIALKGLNLFFNDVKTLNKNCCNC